MIRFSKRLPVVFAVFALAPVFVWSLPARASVLDFSALYFFGDSLSDTGNVFLATSPPEPPPVLPPPTTYADGKFSNGPIWADHLAGTLGFAAPTPFLASPFGPSVSFAFGGSGTGLEQTNPGGGMAPGLLGQVGAFNDIFGGAGGAPVPGTADPDALYVIWSGANDFLLPPPAGFTPDPTITSTNIGDAIGGLHAAGAKNFLVLNLPDLGATPMGGGDPGLSAATTDHNAELDAVLAGLAATLVDLELFFFDVRALVADILADPLAFGFPAGGAPGQALDCLFGGACPVLSTDFAGFGGGFFFWDIIHPTTAAHSLIADGAFAALDIPEPAKLLVFVFGLAVLGASVSRRRNAV